MTDNEETREAAAGGAIMAQGHELELALVTPGRREPVDNLRQKTAVMVAASV